MEAKYISNGDPDRIPAIGSEIPVEPHVLFIVDGYGESSEVPNPLHPGEKAYCLILLGHLKVPAGSPIEVLENLLGGKL